MKKISWITGLISVSGIAVWFELSHRQQLLALLLFDVNTKYVLLLVNRTSVKAFTVSDLYSTFDLLPSSDHN